MKQSWRLHTSTKTWHLWKTHLRRLTGTQGWICIVDVSYLNIRGFLERGSAAQFHRRDVPLMKPLPRISAGLQVLLLSWLPYPLAAGIPGLAVNGLFDDSCLTSASVVYFVCAELYLLGGTQ